MDDLENPPIFKKSLRILRKLFAIIVVEQISIILKIEIPRKMDQKILTSKTNSQQ